MSSTRRAYPSILPANYETRKLSETQRRWQGELGQLVRRWASGPLPGVPLEAIMGFASNGSQNEDLALTSASAGFHELGWFGTEGGTDRLPAPNTDTSKPNSWYPLHNDPRVVAMLGRNATMTPWPVSGTSAQIPVPDQVAIGLANVADNIARMARRVPEGVRPSSLSSLWAVALGFMGWSAGNGGATSHVRRYADALARVPEAERWPAMIRLVAADRSLPRDRRHSNPAYSVIRTQQKLRVGRGLARANGSDLAWYGPIDEAAEDVIGRWVGDGDVSSLPAIAPVGGGMASTNAGRGSSAALVFLGFSAAAAAIIVWRARRGRRS
jgi:hypothetical protein